MKKLKKSSKNKKPVVIFIYGAVAVGKFTVAKTLSKKLGYKLAHNHHVNDFVDEVFTPHTFYAHYMREFLRYSVLENLVKAKINFVTTHCYWHNFVSRTGLSDSQYVKRIEKKLTKLGAKFYPIHLKANEKELLRRVSMRSRRAFRKLHDKKTMREYLSRLDLQTSPKLKNNFVIDNTKLSPQKVSDMIIKHFKLK